PIIAARLVIIKRSDWHLLADCGHQLQALRRERNRFVPGGSVERYFLPTAGGRPIIEHLPVEAGAYVAESRLAQSQARWRLGIEPWLQLEAHAHRVRHP